MQGTICVYYFSYEFSIQCPRYQPIFMLPLHCMIYSWFVLSTRIVISFFRIFSDIAHLPFKDWFFSQFLDFFFFLVDMVVLSCCNLSSVSVNDSLQLKNTSFLPLSFTWNCIPLIPKPIRQEEGKMSFPVMQFQHKG